jgi:hypothetical protein
MAAIVLPTAWSEIDPETYINQTRDEIAKFNSSNTLNFTGSENFTDSNGNTFQGNNLDMKNKVKIINQTNWPICGLFNLPSEQEYRCHTA